MIRFLRILLGLTVFLAIVTALFTALMFAAKIWGIYSIPPSEKNLKGATLIVSRDETEPFLNASDRPKPLEPETPTPRPTGYGAGIREIPPIERRIIVKLPYINWIHEEAKDTTSSR